MREELQEKLLDLLINSGIGGISTTGDLLEDIIALIDQGQQDEASGVSIDSALTSFNKLEAAVREQLALIDEIKAVLNPASKSTNTRYIDEKRSHPKAVELYRQGVPVNWSTDIGDELSSGYGELDDYGFWEFPLYFKPEPKAEEVRI